MVMCYDSVIIQRPMQWERGSVSVTHRHCQHTFWGGSLSQSFEAEMNGNVHQAF